jgi:hypothetical protein
MALKESSLREERLWPSAQKIKAGEGSREEHAELVNTIKPVRPYAQPVPPASDEEVHDALSKDKKPSAFAPRAIPKGTPVAVRLDIPAYEQKNTWVVSVHHPKSDFTAGPVIGYDSVAHIDNPRFGVHPTGALNIASGKPKSTIATVHGNWRSTTPEKAYALAQTIHENPEWRQVGMDPERHSYFYDRETQQPVIAADEALHIGPLVYAKNPVYDKLENYKFADGGAADFIPHDDKRRTKNLKDFHGKTPKEIKAANWFHGTRGDFSSFKEGKPIFVTQEPSFANQYTGINTRDPKELADLYDLHKKTFGRAPSPNVMPVHVRAEKPFDYENRKHIAALYEELGPDLIMDPYLLKFMDEVREGHWGAIESTPIQNAIKAMGHDSFYVKENGEKNLGVYDPSQIKSATGNQGTFDPSNPDITKKRGGEVETKTVDVDHPNFRSWFGNSVLHDEGKPVRYYHGTSKDTDFKKFKMGRHGVWLTSDPDSASSYAKENDSQTSKLIPGTWKFQDVNTASRVIPVYAKIENPFTGDRPEFNTENYKKAQSDWFDVLRSQGYDGWVPAKHKGQLAVALSRPDQVKSAISNTGDYSDNPEIHKADGGATDDDGITAYHGSPHDFEQFNTSKIGTGEGAQAYGHGLYFAENEDVAKGYKERLAPAANVQSGGQNLNQQQLREIVEELGLPYPAATAANAFSRLQKSDNVENYLQQLNQIDHESLRKNFPKVAAEIDAEHALAKELHKRGLDIDRPNKGHMYEVHIKAHPDHFLDWDKPLREQKEVLGKILSKFGGEDAVRNAYSRWDELNSNLIQDGRAIDYDALNPLWQEYDRLSALSKDRAIIKLGGLLEKLDNEAKNPEKYPPDRMVTQKGEDLWRAVSQMDKSNAAASLAFHEIGVPGIKYFDAGSRGASGKRTRNYVVFDHNHVAVKRKYAQGGVVG